MSARFVGWCAVGLSLLCGVRCSRGASQHASDASSTGEADGGLDASDASDAAATGAAIDGALPKTGAPPCRILAPQANQVQFAAAGTILYAGGLAPNLIDTRSWTVRQSFSADRLPAFVSTISRDGALIATLDGDSFLRVWDAATGAEKGHVPVTLDITQVLPWAPAVAFAPDASQIAAVDSGTDVRVFARAGLAQAWRATAPAKVSWLAFSGDGQTVLAAQPDRVLRFDATSGTAQPPIMVPGAGGAVAISGDGKLLALDSFAGMAIVRVADGSVLRTLPSTRGQVIALSQDGAMVATWNAQATITVQDAVSGAVLRTFPGGPTTLAFSPDGAALAAIQDNVIVWRLSDGSVIYEAGGRDRTVTSPTANVVASDTGSDATFVWDLSTGALRRRMPIRQRTDVVSSLSFDGRGNLFIDAFSHGEVWDLSSGTFASISYAPASQPPEWSGGELLTPDGQWIVSGGDGSDVGAIRVWNVATGTVARSFHGHNVEISALVIDPTGTLLASAGPEVPGSAFVDPQDNEIKIWDFASGTRLQTLIGHSRRIGALAFSPDSKTLLSGGWEGLVRLWSVADGSVVRDFAVANQPNALSPPQYGAGLFFSPNGRFVASAGYDPPPGANTPVTPGNLVAIWATDSGQLIRRLDAWGGIWWPTAGWSFDGQFIVAPGPAEINVWCVGDLEGAAP